VIVIVPRVAGDAVSGGWVFFCGEVVEGEGDNGFTAGENFPWVTAALDIALEPAHVAGVSFLDPLKVVIGVGGTGSGCNAAVVEAELAGDELDVGFDDVW